MAKQGKIEQGRYAREWGKTAEDIATEFLTRKGYPILERNWSPAGGHKEIDIISQKDNYIIFIEVKARSGRDLSPLEALTPQKLNNIYRCAESYLKMMPGQHWRYRFDIITIEGNPSDYSLNHIEDAFLGPLKSYR